MQVEQGEGARTVVRRLAWPGLHYSRGRTNKRNRAQLLNDIIDGLISADASARALSKMRLWSFMEKLSFLRRSLKRPSFHS